MTATDHAARIIRGLLYDDEEQGQPHWEAEATKFLDGRSDPIINNADSQYLHVRQLRTPGDEPATEALILLALTAHEGVAVIEDRLAQIVGNMR